MNEDWVDITSLKDRMNGYEVQLNIQSPSSEMRHRLLGDANWQRGERANDENLTLDDER